MKTRLINEIITQQGHLDTQSGYKEAPLYTFTREETGQEITSEGPRLAPRVRVTRRPGGKAQRPKV